MTVPKLALKRVGVNVKCVLDLGSEKFRRVRIGRR